MVKKVLKQYLAGLFSGLLTRATRQVSLPSIMKK